MRSMPALMLGLLLQIPIPPTQTPTIQANTKLVILDVVVTDNGIPVHNLKASDFTIDEDKSPQTIKSFEEHAAPVATAPVEVLPPGVFSNRTLNPTKGPMNILLIDLLNTPPTAVKRLNLQILAYLHRMKPGTQLAIFALDSQLRYMQGFTSDQTLLLAAVQASIDRFQTDEFALQRMLATPCNNEERPVYTRVALQDLTRYLAGLPGRKNLIWFTARFPYGVKGVRAYDPPREQVGAPPGTPGAPTMAAGLPGQPQPCDLAADPGSASANYMQANRTLQAAQIAVYLGDARGLDGDKNKIDEDMTMQQLAHDTGGDFITNNNELAGFLEKSIADGSTYYTLTYDPTNKAADGKYRKIQVALAQKGYELYYRRGYYAEDAKADARSPKIADTAATSAAQKAVDTAMRHGLPGPTEILLKTFVGPARGPDEPTATEGALSSTPNPKISGPFRRYRVTFAASPAELTFTKLAEGKYQLDLEFVVFCYDANGVLINSVDKIAKTPVTREDVAAMLKTGYTFRETISVPVNANYFLRIGVHDMPSNKMGVLEIPTDAVKNLQPDPRP